MNDVEEKREAQRFWKAVYVAAHSDSDRRLTREALLAAIDDLEDMFRFRGQMAVVAQRLSTIRNADMICVLEHGPIVETDTYDELLANGRRFAELHGIQYSETVS